MDYTGIKLQKKIINIHRSEMMLQSCVKNRILQARNETHKLRT